MATFFCDTVINSVGLFGLASLQLSQSQYTDELTNYFNCESSGSNEIKVCERSFEDILNPLPTTIVFFLTGILVQLLILLYVINLREVYRGVKHLLSRGIHTCMIYSSSAGRSTKSSKIEQ